MIRKSGDLFSEKIMLKQLAKARWLDLKSSPFSPHTYGRQRMTKRRFATGLACAAILLAGFPAFAGWAQQPEAPLKAGRPIKAGDVLSGELNALRVRDAKMGRRV